MPASNDTRVRVDVFWKIITRVRPCMWPWNSQPLPFHAAGEREYRADVVIVPELPVDEVFRCFDHASGS